MKRLRQGFTLIELMVVVAVAGVLVLLVAPSFKDMILMQRLRGASAQFVTDMQFARSEAVSRHTPLRVVMRQDDSQTCYTLFTAVGNTGSLRCDCLLGIGTACPATSVEIKTVSFPRGQGVVLSWPVDALNPKNAFAYHEVTADLVSIPTDLVSAPLISAEATLQIDDARALRTLLKGTGRPQVCSPNPQRMQVAACP